MIIGKCKKGLWSCSSSIFLIDSVLNGGLLGVFEDRLLKE